jgi:hypothetical protein
METQTTSPPHARPQYGRAGWHRESAQTPDIDFAMYALLEDYGVLTERVWHAGAHITAAKRVMPDAVFRLFLEACAAHSAQARALCSARVGRCARRKVRRLRVQPMLRPVVWTWPQAVHRARPPPGWQSAREQLNLYGQSEHTF